jgi:hypothetical protein
MLTTVETLALAYADLEHHHWQLSCNSHRKQLHWRYHSHFPTYLDEDKGGGVDSTKMGTKAPNSESIGDRLRHRHGHANGMRMKAIGRMRRPSQYLERHGSRLLPERECCNNYNKTLIS